jgi:hypothetical protein
VGKYVRSNHMNVKTISTIGLGYFVLFTLFYIGRFWYAWQAFMKYHSTPTGVSLAYTISAGSIIFEKDNALYSEPLLFKVMAILAVIGAGIWIYQTMWGDRVATSG